MVTCYDGGIFLIDGHEVLEDAPTVQAQLMQRTGREVSRQQAREGTIAYRILGRHDRSENPQQLRLRFDSLSSHDIAEGRILPMACASGMTSFPIPYVLTDGEDSCGVQDVPCCARSAAERYGGIYLPPTLAALHSYNRERMSGCGRMILGSDSPTRYGALGTMGVGEGGGELVKQLMGRTCDLPRPRVVAVLLRGTPSAGVGPQDVALALIRALRESGIARDNVLEFVGDGVGTLSVDYRSGIDVMTPETACWSTIWRTDQAVKDYFSACRRPEAFEELSPEPVAYYDGVVTIELSEVKPSIALPFGSDSIWTIDELRETPDRLRQMQADAQKRFGIPCSGWEVRGGEIYVDRGVIAGCAGGTFENLCAVADLLDGQSIGANGFSLRVCPAGRSDELALTANGAADKIRGAGARFGAGNPLAEGQFSIGHATRSMESAVARMDARSIAATAIRGGRLTAATESESTFGIAQYFFHRDGYNGTVYDGVGRPNPSSENAPTEGDEPEFPALPRHLLLEVASALTDPVTTTEELLPAAGTASERSNPRRLAEYTLSRRDPDYVAHAKRIRALEETRRRGGALPEKMDQVYRVLGMTPGCEMYDIGDAGIGSAIVSVCIGEGSTGEQAACCQRILGGWANLCRAYATRRYRTDLMNHGVVPFTISNPSAIRQGDFVFVPDVRRWILAGERSIEGLLVGETVRPLVLTVGELTLEERKILAAGGLMNYYRSLL